MLTTEDLKMIAPGELAWPITWRFHYRAPWGDTQQTMSVDCAGLDGAIEASGKLGEMLFRASIASAMTREVSLVRVDTVCWKLAPVGIPHVPLFATGLLTAAPSPRRHSACLVLGTGHHDEFSSRQFYVPGIPASFVEDGLLTTYARQSLEQLGQAMVMGLCGHLTFGPMKWLIAYPEIVPADAGNPNGVGFRLVDELRVPYHTRRAPDPAGEDWP